MPLNHTAIDFVWDAAGNGLNLIAADGSRIFSPAPTLTLEGRIYQVPNIEPSWLRACRLPAALGESQTTSQVWTQLSDFAAQWLKLDPANTCLVLAFALGTWFADLTLLVPTLWAVSPEPSDRMNFLRFLHFVCRRPLLLADCRLRTVLARPAELRPTILAPAPSRISASFIAWLECGLYRGFHMPQARALQALSYPKAIVAPEFPESCGPLLQLALPPGSIASPSDIPGEAVADLQASLLRYRLDNYERVRTQNFVPPPFASPAVREIAQCLGICMGDEDIRSQLMEALAPTDDRARLDRSADLHAIALESLLLYCHEDKDKVQVKDLAKAANEILAGRGERFELTPRQVGALLDELGFRTMRLGSRGRGLRLDQSLRVRIHQLAEDYNVCSVPQAQCAECRQIRSAPASSA